MRLSDLIDLEAQLVIDEGIDPDLLRQRERAIYKALPSGVSANRHRLLSAWLQALRDRQQGSAVSTAIMTGYRGLSYLLVLFGFLSGAGVAQALLYYDGRTPVNVGAFLLAVVGVQVVLLAGAVLALLLMRVWSNIPILSDVRALLRFFASRLEPAIDRVGRQLPSDLRDRWAVARSRLRTRARLYQPVEQWWLVELTQLFGIAFNLGVLLLCLRLIYFSDLAFGWSTTAEALGTDTMYRIVRTMAAPWAWLAPAAVPSFELVEQSQFSRLQGGFRAEVTDVFVGQWWRFLVASVVTYGLLPRVLIWGAARSLRAWALVRLPLDTPDVERVVQRLRTPYVETQAVGVPPPSAAEPKGNVEALPRPAPADAGKGCVVIRWRDVPAASELLTDSIAKTFGYQLSAVMDAGGVDVSVDADSQRRAADTDQPLIVLAEAWEAPDKGLRRYLRALRTAAGPERPIYVALVGEGTTESLAAPATDDVALWRDRLTLLEDPYLGVMPLEAA